MLDLQIEKNELNLNRLNKELKDALLPINGISYYEGVVTIHFSVTPLQAQIDLATLLVINHNPVDSFQIYYERINSAITFANELMVKYAAQNVIMGITQANKTKDVADYLASVMRYAQSGSLYEVIAEIDRLIAAGIPANLDPFVNEARLLDFKAKVLEYLGQ